MSYDNSKLARLYLHTWQVTRNEFFRIVTEEIFDSVVGEMTYIGASANHGNATDKVGGVALFSTQDADPTLLRSGDDHTISHRESLS